MRRRAFLGGLMVGALVGDARADEALVGQLREGGLAILLRHARTVPGTGDPPGFRLDDCATQRNLSEAGRAESRAWGEFLRREGIPVGYVGTSAWCRCRETAELIGIGPVERLQPLDSFFEDRGRRDAQTAELRAWIAAWNGPGNALLVTHQVNITALTGEVPGMGEAVVVDRASAIRGRLPPPAVS